MAEQKDPFASSGLDEFKTGVDISDASVGDTGLDEEVDFSDFEFGYDDADAERQEFAEFTLIPPNTWVPVKITSVKLSRNRFPGKDEGKPQWEVEADLTVAAKEQYGTRRFPYRFWVPLYKPQSRTGGSIWPFHSLMVAAGKKKELEAARKSKKLPDTNTVLDAEVQAQIFHQNRKYTDSSGEQKNRDEERVSATAGFYALGEVPPETKRASKETSGLVTGS